MHRAGSEQAFLALAVKILVGAIAYVGGALIVARPTTKDFFDLAQSAIRKRRGRRSAPS